MRKLQSVVIGAILITSFQSAAVQDIAPLQDPALLSRAQEGESGYRERQSGQIYEGFYEEKVSLLDDENFTIVALWMNRFPASWDPLSVITITRPLIDARDTLRVRVVSTSLDHFYRMDAWFYGSDEIDWGIGAVVQNASSPSRLEPNDVGLFGWYEDDLDIVHVPLRFSPGLPIEQGQCELVLRSDLNLSGYKYYITSPDGKRVSHKHPIDSVDLGGLVVIPLKYPDGGRLKVEFRPTPVGQAKSIPLPPIHIRIPENAD